ncbi:MAG: UvrD-helicase domain-containing protein [Lentisphaeria bacterium]|nr:UvrD-helicase domain-containing protein [Lentisphaeria bacterium]
MTPEEIFAGLNPEQAEAASTIEGPVLVLAGAGTGKTRVITDRIAGMLASGIPAENILGLTFTNKAAREMRERLAGLVDPDVARRVTVGTFHSFCIRLLRKEIHYLGYLPGFTVADESDQQGLLKQAAAQKGLTQQGLSVPDALAKISGWKNQLLTPREARRRAETDYDIVVGELYEEYQNMLENQNMIDFDDMLMLTCRLFREFPEVLERYRERYHYLLVDEYQDTNDAQFEVVKQIAGERCNLCVVGDDDQSIYSWRGANISNILDFPQMFPGTKVIRLEQNYRSTARILSAANAVISGNSSRHDKALWSDLGDGDPVTVIVNQTGTAEAETIANMILQEKMENPSCSYKDFAILYRSNHLSRELESAMRAARIPYRLVGGQEFYKRKEVKDATCYLRLLVNPKEDQSLLRILPIPPRGLAQKAVDTLKSMHAAQHKPMSELLGTAEFQQALGGKGAESAKELSRILEQYRALFRTPGGLAGKAADYLDAVGYTSGLQRIYKDYKDAMKRRENIDEFLNAIAQFEQKNGPESTLADCLESFSLLEENDRTKEEDAAGNQVTLCTVHASKGLEFPVVFVVAVENGIFPNERALEEGSLEEERRLMYVAITRARKKLFLSRAQGRMIRGLTRIQLPSPFLEELPEGEIRQETADGMMHSVEAEDLEQSFADIFSLLDD